VRQREKGPSSGTTEEIVKLRVVHY
jgi:hypothetical protein